jgi:WD40 repeat protein
MIRLQIVLASLVLACCCTSANALPPTADYTLFASDYSRGLVKVDPVSGEVLSTVFAASGISDIERGPDGLIYLSNSSQRVVQAVNPFTGALVRTITFAGDPQYSYDARPMDLAFGPDGRLYASVMDVPFFGNIYVVGPNDTHSTQHFNPTLFAGLPLGIEFGPDGNLYVVSESSGNFYNRLDRLNGATGVVEAMLADQNEGLSLPTRLTIAADGTIFVGNQGWGDRAITSYTVNGDLLQTIPVASGGLNGLTLLPDGDLVWGDGGANFMRYDFATQMTSVFSTGYGSAQKMIAIPEPASCALALLAALALVKRPRRAGLSK